MTGLAFLLSCSASTPADPSPDPTVASLRPDPEVLVVQEQPIALPNLDWSDLGVDHGWGDSEANNGVPDGWRLRVKKGRFAFDDDTVTLGARTNGVLFSRAVPAKAGETVVLRTRFRADQEGVGNLGVAFRDDQRMIAFESVRLRSETASSETAGSETEGWTEVELRATAPEGTQELFLRWLQLGNNPKPLDVTVAPITLARLEAQSRTRTFDLSKVILITIETLRYDHTTLAGYPRQTTPTLAALAQQGVSFPQHMVQAPYTRPSLASLLTSEYPELIGVTDNFTSALVDATTLAEHFANNGYVTSAFLAQFVLSQNYGFNRGFHYFSSYPNQTDAEVVFADWQAWLDEHAEDNFFTWLHFFDPHGPYLPDPATPDFEGDALWLEDAVSVAGPKGKGTGPFVPRYVQQDGESQRRAYVNAYDREVAGVDAVIGRLVADLRSRGLDDEVLIAVTADHGESMTDHDRYFCHGSLYQHDLHVPLVLWGPGHLDHRSPPQNWTANLDVAPTLLDYAGITMPQHMRGQSLRPLVEDTTRGQWRAFTMAQRGSGPTAEWAAVAPNGLKLMLDGQGQLQQAFDLTKDPTEGSPTSDPRLERLQGHVSGWLEMTIAKERDAARPTERDLTKEERQQLEALGYVE